MDSTNIDNKRIEILEEQLQSLTLERAAENAAHEADVLYQRNIIQQIRKKNEELQYEKLQMSEQSQQHQDHSNLERELLTDVNESENVLDRDTLNENDDGDSTAEEMSRRAQETETYPNKLEMSVQQQEQDNSNLEMSLLPDIQGSGRDENDDEDSKAEEAKETNLTYVNEIVDQNVTFQDHVDENRGSMTPNHEPEDMDTGQPKSMDTKKKGASKPSEFSLKSNINILILGETGVGKSTWINGIANYLIYNTMEKAEAGDNVSLIQTAFTMTDENYKQILVTTVPVKTAISKPKGQSDTQETTTYVFKIGNATVRLIDTPGIGDTRGSEQDNKNFQNILDHLSEYREIHGICILLKPNNARLTVMFRFCIQELLTHLHKNASKNIVFCFTNCRGTFYRPGDTMPPLEEMLKKAKDVEIPLHKDNIYCMDNESVRFLAAIKQGIIFTEDERKNYSVSWDKSVKETVMLFEYVSKLIPHNVGDTLSLNNARVMILQLSKPLAEIQLNVQRNILLQKQQQDEIDAAKSWKDKLALSLRYEYTDLEATAIDHPRTVCTNKTCVEVVPIRGKSSKTKYKTHCHSQCGIRGVDAERIGHPHLQRCSAMNNTGICKVCGHNWQIHMHIRYETTTVLKEDINEEVQQKLADKDTAMQVIENRKLEIVQFVEKLNHEQQHISKVSAQLAHFLKVNAITPYNDAIEEYLNYLIHAEKQKSKELRNEEMINGLKESVNAYKQEVQILEEAMANRSGNKKPLTLFDIYGLVESLYNLEINGNNIKQIMDVSTSTIKHMAKQRELYGNTPNMVSKFGATSIMKNNFITRNIVKVWGYFKDF